MRLTMAFFLEGDDHRHGDIYFGSATVLALGLGAADTGEKTFSGERPFIFRKCAKNTQEQTPLSLSCVDARFAEGYELNIVLLEAVEQANQVVPASLCQIRNIM